MSARGMSMGHTIVYDDGEWRYTDGCVFDGTRPCTACGEPSLPCGADPCLGVLPGVVAACCGHGIEDGYVRRNG